MVVAMQDVISPTEDRMAELGNRCIFNYNPAVSPDFYGWIFPKGNSVLVGVGTRFKNKSKLESYLSRMKELNSDLLEGGEVLKRNGALIPVGLYREHGVNRVLLTGDSAGFVLPACGEGIYFAMKSGEIAAEIIKEFGAKRPDLVVTKYTDLVNAEFSSIFKYFRKIENLMYKSVINREVFVRLAGDKFLAQKILRAFSTKIRTKTPFFKKFTLFLNIMAIRMNVAMSISKQPDFGK